LFPESQFGQFFEIPRSEDTVDRDLAIFAHGVVNISEIATFLPFLASETKVRKRSKTGNRHLLNPGRSPERLRPPFGKLSIDNKVLWAVAGGLGGGLARGKGVHAGWGRLWERIGGHSGGRHQRRLVPVINAPINNVQQAGAGVSVLCTIDTYTKVSL
jgi:hypothetical protein